MDKVNIPALEALSSLSENSKVVAYDPVAGKTGLAPVSLISGSGWCGRRWNVSASSPVGEAVGNINKLANLPDLLGLGCYLVQNNHSRRKLSASNHYQFAGGGTALLDGTMGHYQWGWGTGFYYAAWTEGSYLYEAIDLVPIKGKMNYYIPIASRSASGFATIDRTNNIMVSYCNTDAQYRGGNNDSSKDGQFNTQLGRPASSMTAAAFEAAARRNGDRWCATFHAMEFITGALFRIIMGTRNVQTAFNANLDANGLHQGGIGDGVSAPTDWSGAWEYFPFLPMDAGASEGDKLGTILHTLSTSGGGTEVRTMSSFFGLKNFYHYLYNMCPSLVCEDNADLTMSFYATLKLDSNAFDNTTKTGKQLVCTSPVNSAEWKYISQLNMEYLCGVPLALDGSSSTYFCDGFYKDSSTSGLRLALLGGNAVDGALCGLACLSANRGVSNSSASCGSALCEAAEDWDTTPFLGA